VSEFDVIVVGAGPAGENVAGRCAAGGLSTVIVERELVGGECSYWGCIPSKTLARPGDVIAAARRVPGAAAAVTGQIDVAAALARRDYMTGNWDDAGALGWLESEGIELVRGAGRLAGERTVEVETKAGDVRRQILVAVGRRPSTADIGLDTVGLEPGRYVEVDDQLRATGVAGGWLYAVGDCNGRALLTHMGKYQARLAGDVILGKNVAATAPVPRVTFTDPQVCAVGLTEAQAREAGVDVRIVTYPTGNVSGASTQGDGITGTSQLVIDESRRVIVGATFTGPGVAELLHSATIAIVGEVTMDQLWHAVPSFPTVSEVWLRLMEAYGL